MTPADLPDQVDAMNASLAELGHNAAARPPTPSEAERFPTVSVMVRADVPKDLSWKAGALYALTEHGADHPWRCINASGFRGWNIECPRHPVGALLAGTTPPCPATH